MNDITKTPDKPIKHRKSLEERLDAARKREAKAAETLRRRKVKLQKYESQQRSQARRLDTRRKVIAGGLALKHMEFDGRYALALKALIDEYVTRDDERALFDLPPLPDNDQRRISPPKVY